MKCPKCAGEMEVVTYHTVKVDRCAVCKGLWFDELELDQIKDRIGARTIDSGDPALGKKYNAVRGSCPRCGGRGEMLPMVDFQQPHIWYESCKVCHGVFLDAGELTDMQDVTLADYIRDLFASERK